jgi:hypothetical protein
MAGRELRTPLAIAAVVVLLDQLTKHWALNALAGGHVIDLVGSLRFNLAFNRGMASRRPRGWDPSSASLRWWWSSCCWSRSDARRAAGTRWPWV